MEVIHELLGNTGIKIYQDDELFTFTIDSILLASFATIKKNTKKILDIGCGNAPIALYLSKRTDAKIFGIEIQEKLYNLGVKSVKINMRENQISLINDDLNNLDSYFALHTFDLVVSNPPFFKIDKDSNVNPNEVKRIARHEIKTNLDEICKMASLMLNNNGIFSLVHRPERLTDILVCLRKYNLEPKRIRFVYPNENKESNQVLIEAVYNAKRDGLKVLKPLYVHPVNKSNNDEIIKIYNGTLKE